MFDDIWETLVAISIFILAISLLLAVIFGLKQTHEESIRQYELEKYRIEIQYLGEEKDE